MNVETFILAAGLTDYLNMTQGLTASKLLTIVNGRPIISWVVGSCLRSSKGHITLVLNADDLELVSFCHSRFGRNSRLRIVTISESRSILHTLQAGVQTFQGKSNGARIILGDTLLTEVDYEAGDHVWVSDYLYDSEPWCVVSLNQDMLVSAYFDKISGLSPERHKALVGRYDFLDAAGMITALNEALDNGMHSISDMLKIYGQSKPVTAKYISSERWIDFGHLEGVVKARARLMESRAFNSLCLHDILPLITKTSTQTKKLQHELEWYRKLTGELAALTPRIFKSEKHEQTSVIVMEYYGYGTLAEKFLFYKLSPGFWANVLSRLLDVVDLFKKFQMPTLSDEVNLKRVYCDKTFKRITDLRKQGNGWSQLLDAEMLLVNGTEYVGLPKLTDYIKKRSDDLCRSASCSIVHGDLCFNNILYDISSGVVKLIDPRGEFGADVSTIYGDPRYDIAKLRHSFCGNYDYIIEGDFEIAKNGDAFVFSVFKDKQAEREFLFDDLCRDYGYDISDIRFIEALLFLSMIPLHGDSMSRQTAFFLNGLIKLNECYERDRK